MQNVHIHDYCDPITFAALLRRWDSGLAFAAHEKYDRDEGTRMGWFDIGLLLATQ